MNIILEAVKKFLEKAESYILPRSDGPIREATRQKRVRYPYRQNHGKGESKARRKLAVASNKINRRRVKGWKH